jgi:hypothetical protein
MFQKKKKKKEKTEFNVVSNYVPPASAQKYIARLGVRFFVLYSTILYYI